MCGFVESALASLRRLTMKGTRMDGCEGVKIRRWMRRKMVLATYGGHRNSLQLLEKKATATCGRTERESQHMLPRRSSAQLLRSLEMVRFNAV